MSTQGCQTYTSNSHDDEARCLRLPVVVVTVGCKHEHLDRTEVCSICLEDLRKNLMICTECLDHPESPHRCVKMLLKIEPRHSPGAGPQLVDVGGTVHSTGLTHWSTA